MHASERTQAPLLRFPTGRNTALEALVRRVRESLTADAHHSTAVPEIIAGHLKHLLPVEELLNSSQRQPSAESYKRHTIYRDPDGAFTIMALVWLPGHETPVHAHMTWGAVGIYSGDLQVTNYEIYGTRGGSMHLRETEQINASAGATCCVTGGIDDIHKIKNVSSKPAISVHIYGMDVPPESQALNILFPQ